MGDNMENEAGKAVKEDLSEEISETSAETTENTIEEIPELSSEEKLATLEKEHLYLRAELENIKRQNLKERSQLLKYGGERFARDLLDTLDLFRSALSTKATEDNFKGFIKGIELTSQSLKTMLEKHGVTEVESIGQAFDPNTHEALSSEPSDEHPEGTVTQVFKAAYKYHDKLLRPGQVIVSRGPSDVT